MAEAPSQSGAGGAGDGATWRPPLMRGAGPVATAVAAHGLEHARLDLPSTPLSDSSWRDLLAEAHAQRIGGLLVQAISDGALAATPEQAAAARRLLRAAAAHAVRLEAKLLAVADLLEGGGITYRVLKGTAVARIAYPDPVLRSFIDIDLLVPSERFDAAAALLAGGGAVRRFAEPRPGFDRRFSKGARFTGPDGIEIDLHRTFTSGPFGLTVDLPALFERSSTFELAGRQLPALCPEEGFLHLCFHAALGDWPPRLVPLRDIAQMLASVPLDVERLHRLARTWKAEPVVAHAMRLTWETFDLADRPPLFTWASAFRPSRRQAAAMRLCAGPRRSYRAQTLANLFVIRGVAARLAYLRALALPDRNYLADREGSYLRRWWSATRLALSGRGR